jgi:uncharacterized protein YprB with RNaseH-like and TPR domain
MTLPHDWPRVFRELLPHAACIDIETCHWNGPIAVVGIFRPKEGAIEVTQLVRGQTLTAEALRDALAGVQLIITFNGNTHDIPKMLSQFPGALPLFFVSLDLFEVAKSLDLKAGLKLLEGQFGIDRPEWQIRRRHIAVKLWKCYDQKGIQRALESLLEYNRQDTENLYFLAQTFIRLKSQKEAKPNLSPA